MQQNFDFAANYRAIGLIDVGRVNDDLRFCKSKRFLYSLRPLTSPIFAAKSKFCCTVNPFLRRPAGRRYLASKRAARRAAWPQALTHCSIQLERALVWSRCPAR